MGNAFGGQCFRCGTYVKAGEGHFERVGRKQIEKYGDRVVGRKWLIQHARCAIDHRGTSQCVFPEHDFEV